VHVFHIDSAPLNTRKAALNVRNRNASPTRTPSHSFRLSIWLFTIFVTFPAVGMKNLKNIFHFRIEFNKGSVIVPNPPVLQVQDK
jgi:hypothetical protein